MQPLAPLLIGFAFGWVLQKGKLGRYETVVNVFRFTDLTLLKFLVSALLVAMLGIQTLVSLGLADELPVPATSLLGNLLGGLVFGAGMALTGFCPGTVAAGAGEGRLDYAVAGSLGLYAGAVLFGLAYPTIAPLVSGGASYGSVTLAQAMQVDPWLVVILFWEVGLLLLYVIERGAIERGGPRRSRSLASLTRGVAGGS